MESGLEQPPMLACGRLPEIDIHSWEAIEAAFHGAQSCALKQTWLPAPEPGFRPAKVRTGWRPEALYVLADLDDADIFNPETRFNEPSFMVGDVFEMFLRPQEQDPYFEFHVTPRNQKFQLRIPRENALQSLPPGVWLPAEWMVRQPVIESRVNLPVGQERWRVLAVIPFALVVERGAVEPGACWRFSFSRYDYTRGAAGPVLSSSSPHRELSFHRQQEWGTLQFL